MRSMACIKYGSRCSMSSANEPNCQSEGQRASVAEWCETQASTRGVPGVDGLTLTRWDHAVLPSWFGVWLKEADKQLRRPPA